MVVAPQQSHTDSQCATGQNIICKLENLQAFQDIDESEA